ncbi:MAG: PASTA domain-containing protein [Deltaproteobacteria bacterium]|nr:PASTA domain-containing protein [Deltaproteobacteria bacterium]
MRSQALRSAAIRVGALRLMLLFALLLLAARAGQLTLVNTDGKLHGNRQIHARISVPSARGLILDRDRTELAISVDAPSIYVVPRLLEDRKRTSRELARILDLDRRQLGKRIEGHEGFTYVARWVTEKQAERIAALELQGVGIEYEPRRTYPAGSLAAPLIGFADIDGVGVRGVEQMLDGWLKGQPRVADVQRDARGRLLSSSPLDPRLAAGGDVVLSIDSGLQGQAEAALAEAVKASGAKGGVIISVDPKTGDVLALAEAPGFDPNRFRHMSYENTRSRSFLDMVEPGSTMKAFVVAAALDAGAISPEQTFDTGEGWMRVPGKTIRDHRPYGILDPAGVLTVSSNVGIVQIGQQLGPEAHYDALLRFGFGQPTGSGFPTESGGLVRDWQDWQPVDHATISFGQGISVTPMQLAMAVASLANGGERMRPRLVLARRRPMGEWEQSEPTSVGQAVSPETAASVIGMLEQVVSAQGTGRRAALANVRVAGKTGTAQKLDRAEGRYSQTRYTAWFFGIAPADDPRLAIVVALDEPQGTAHTGGAVAAPLFARVAAAQLAHQGILTQPEQIAARPLPTLMAEQEAPEPTEQEERDVQAVQEPTIESRTKAGATIATPIARTPEVAAVPDPPEVRQVPKVQETPRPKAEQPRHVASTSAVAKPPPVSAPPARSAVLQASHEIEALPAVFVPDFRGETVGAARSKAARESIDLHVLGVADGRVVEQSPAPGTILGGRERTVILSFATGRESG